MRNRIPAWLPALAFTGAVCCVQAQEAAPPMTVHSINERVHWVEGGGGNAGIVIGTNSVVVIDAKTTAQTGAELVKLAGKLTPKPITHVILTHSDGDHVNGLAGFAGELKIIAHKNNKVEQLSTLQHAVAEVGGGRCLPPADRLPNAIVFDDRVAVTIDGVRFVLHHFGPSHTQGDLVVELPDDELAFVGDLITDRLLIHPEKNGTLAGWLATAEKLLSLDVRTYVGGHSAALDNKESLRRRAEGYRALQEKVDAMVDAGRSLPEVKAAMGDPLKDPSGCRGIPWPSLSTVAFHERADHNAALRSDDRTARTESGHVRLLATRAIHGPLDAVLSQLQAAAKMPVVVEYGSAKGNLRKEILDGKEFELAILLPDVNQELLAAGRIDARTYDLAKVPTAIGIRGQATVDVNTPDALRRTLLAARSVDYSPTGTGVVAVRNMIAALGLAGKLNDTSEVDGEVTLRPGEYEIVFYPLSEMLARKELTSLGPLPSQFQVPVVLQAAIGANARAPDATLAVLRFLQGPGFDPALERSGMTRSASTHTKQTK